MEGSENLGEKEADNDLIFGHYSPPQRVMSGVGG